MSVPGHEHVRVATWNVHAAIGIDLRRSIDRIADVLRHLAVDIALLQELDVGRARSERVDQPSAIALRLGYTHVFGAAIVDGASSYGNAIVSRVPLEEPQTFLLPTGTGAEHRAATRAIAQTALGPLEVVVTHFGLLARDRERQADALVAELGQASVPRVVGGDMNDGPLGKAVVRLRGDDLVRAASPATFPAYAPFFRLDHILVDRRMDIVDVERPSVRTIRGASDHLPVVVTLARRGRA